MKWKEVKMFECPNCNHLSDIADKFCEKCNQPLEYESIPLNGQVVPKIAETMIETFNLRHKAYKDIECLKEHIDELEVYIEDLTILANNIRMKYF